MKSYQSSVEKCLTAEGSDSKDISIKDSNILDKTKINVLVEKTKAKSKDDLAQYDVISDEGSGAGNGRNNMVRRNQGFLNTAFPVIMPPKKGKKTKVQMSKQMVY